jgi:hypothetical protein
MRERVDRGRGFVFLGADPGDISSEFNFCSPSVVPNAVMGRQPKTPWLQKPYRAGRAWGNAGWLEIPYFGVMVSAASAARG